MDDYRIKFFLKTLAFIIALTLMYFVFLNIVKISGFSIQDTKNFIQNLGIWGIFVAEAFIVLSVITPFPESPFALIATVIYGPIIGFLLIIFGTLLGSLLDFIIFRKLFRKLFSERKPIWNENLNIITKRFGFELIVFLRIFPTLSFDYVSYIFALSKIKLKNFLIASLLGFLPMALVYLLIGINTESADNYRILLNLIIGSFIILSLFFARSYLKEKYTLNKLEGEKDNQEKE